MPAITPHGSERGQWTVGSPNITAELLNNVFIYLQQGTTTTSTKKIVKNTPVAATSGITTNKTKEDHYTNDTGEDVTSFYNIIFDNINRFFNVNGKERLVGPTENNRPIDYSALLGAYYRSKLVYPDGTVAVALSNDELQAVYQFVDPIVSQINNELARSNNSPISAAQYLDSFGKSPKENHSTILKALVFCGIPEEKRSSMFGKKSENANNVLETVFNTLEFIRTPLRILIAETEVSDKVAQSKDTVRNPREKAKGTISPVDQQWTHLISGMKQTVTDFSNSDKLFSAISQIEHVTFNLNNCFGTENARITVMSEVAKFLEGKGATDESVALQLDGLRKSVVESSQGTLSAEAVYAMPVFTLFNTLILQWRNAYTLEKQAKEQALLEVQGLNASSSADVEKARGFSSEIEVLKKDLQSKVQELAELTSKLEQITQEKHTAASVSHENNQQVLELNQLQQTQTALTQENTQLQQTNTQLVQENTALKAQLQQIKAPPVDPKIDNLQPAKQQALDVLFELGSKDKNDQNLIDYCKQMSKKLQAAPDIESIHAINQQAKILNTISTTINEIANTLKADDFVSHRGRNKAKAIKEALRTMDVGDRVKLVTKYTNKLDGDYPYSNGLITALSHQRARIFKTSKSTSVKTFWSKVTPVVEEAAVNPEKKPTQT